MTEEAIARVEAEREFRLAKQDIDNPRPQFWKVDLERFRKARAALQSRSR